MPSGFMTLSISFPTHLNLYIESLGPVEFIKSKFMM